MIFPTVDSKIYSEETILVPRSCALMISQTISPACTGKSLETTSIDDRSMDPIGSTSLSTSMISDANASCLHAKDKNRDNDKAVINKYKNIIIKVYLNN